MSAETLGEFRYWHILICRLPSGREPAGSLVVCHCGLQKNEAAMPVIHYVRLGVLGQIGRFVSADRGAVARGHRVVCRTSRGLEVGEVLGVHPHESGASTADGSILRPVTPEDDLLLERLERDREKALSACAQRLEERGLKATLIDVEHLFDGRSLYFYFLGEVTPEIEGLTAELAEVYARRIEFRRFSDALTEGCGPSCGTELALGCGSTCSDCSLASVCRAPLGTAQQQLPQFREGEAPAEPGTARSSSAQQELGPPGGVI